MNIWREKPSSVNYEVQYFLASNFVRSNLIVHENNYLREGGREGGREGRGGGRERGRKGGMKGGRKGGRSPS